MSKQCEGISKNGERCNKKVKIQRESQSTKVLCCKHNKSTLTYKIKNNESSVNKNNESSVNKNEKNVTVDLTKENEVPVKIDNSQSNCPICLENVKINTDAGFTCGHLIHIDCAKQLHNNQCPVCRVEISAKKLSKKDINTIKQKNRDDKQTEDEQMLREFLNNDRQGVEDEGMINNIQGFLNVIMPEIIRASQLEHSLKRANREIPHFGEIWKSYKNLLSFLSPKAPEYQPLEFIIEVFSTMNCVADIYDHTRLPIMLVHNILSADIPPLFEYIDDKELHDMIHLALGMEINEH